MNAWYAVYTQSRMESWARSNLWERGFEVYLPLYRRLRRHARRADYVSSPLFPRYLFVRADLQAGQKPRIATAPGVGSIVSFGNRPSTVPERIIEEIREREDADGYVEISEAQGLNRGDAVQLAHAALCDQVGLFDCASDNERVVILLNLLGRQVRVHVSERQVSRIG